MVYDSAEFRSSVAGRSICVRYECSWMEAPGFQREFQIRCPLSGGSGDASEKLAYDRCQGRAFSRLLSGSIRSVVLRAAIRKTFAVNPNQEKKIFVIFDRCIDWRMVANIERPLENILRGFYESQYSLIRRNRSNESRPRTQRRIPDDIKRRKSSHRFHSLGRSDH